MSMLDLQQQHRRERRSHSLDVAKVASTLGVVLMVLSSARPASATNDEANGRISWFNTTFSDHHTVIFVHGRSELNHSTQRYLLENTSLLHPCRHPELTPGQQYRCAMRQDVNGYWKTSGVRLTSQELYGWFDRADVRERAAQHDYRSIAGSCMVSLGSTNCTRLSLMDDTRVTVTSTSFLDTLIPGVDGYLHQMRDRPVKGRRSVEKPLVPANHQSMHLRNAVFVGYYGDGDPTVWEHVGLDGQPNPHLIANSGPAAQAALDRAMWTFCANGRAEWYGEAPWKSCSLVCHSAGCLAVGTYLAAGWGPGSPYHNDRSDDDPLFAKSGLMEVFSTNSAAGGSRLAELNDGRMGGLFKPQTPMTNALQPARAMGKYPHGQQLGGYLWAPTYYLGADNRMNSMDGSDTNRFFSDDLFFPNWDNTTPNDGAVTGRSQCGGTGTKELAEDGEGDGPTQGRSCAWWAEGGRQYSSQWHNMMETCRTQNSSCRYDRNIDAVSWKTECAYDERKQMCNQNHGTTVRRAVQILSDLW